MIAIHLPSFENEEAAIDWLYEHHPGYVRVVLYRGADGMVRGSALVRRRPTGA